MKNCTYFFRIIFFCMIIQMPDISLAQSSEVQSLLQKATEFYERGKETEALHTYKKVLELRPSNYEALWNTSFLYSRKGQRQATLAEEVIYYERAREIAKKCLEIHPDKPRSHYVYGIATAAIVDDMPNSSERIRMVWTIKEHADRAAEMDPDYAPVWHLLGVWHSNLAGISTAERFAARVIYGKLPEGASREKAEEYLKRAIRMEPNEILFQLDLGQHFQESGQISKAIPVFENVLTMRAISENDHVYQNEARERLAEIRR